MKAALTESVQTRRRQCRPISPREMLSWREAAHGISDEYAGADQTNTDPRDQRRDCTGTHASPRAPAQASGGAGVEHAGNDEVGAAAAILDDRSRVSSPHSAASRLRPRRPDRREGAREQRPG